MKRATSTRVLKDGRTLTIRSPEAHDAGVLLRHLQTLFHESWQDLNQPADHFDTRSFEEESSALLAMEHAPDRFMLCAFLDGQIVGHLRFRAERALLAQHCAQIGLGVVVAAQRLGVARELLHRALKDAAEVGISHVSLRVRTHSQKAIWFVEREGFEKVGVLKKVAKTSAGFADEILYQKLI